MKFLLMFALISQEGDHIIQVHTERFATMAECEQKRQDYHTTFLYMLDNHYNSKFYAKCEEHD